MAPVSGLLEIKYTGSKEREFESLSHQVFADLVMFLLFCRSVRLFGTDFLLVAIFRHRGGTFPPKNGSWLGQELFRFMLAQKWVGGEKRGGSGVD